MINYHFYILGVICSTAAQWTPDPICPYPSYEPIRLPVPGDCTKYYECLGGTKTELSCPAGLEFNAVLIQCDMPAEANCDPDAITTSIWEQTTSPPEQCTAILDEIIYFPYEGDCTKYWECYQLNMYLHQCPQGLAWNQKTKKCDDVKNVDCQSVIPKSII